MTHDEARELEHTTKDRDLMNIIAYCSGMCQDNSEEGDEWGDATWDFYFDGCNTSEKLRDSLVINGYKDADDYMFRNLK